MQIGGLKRCDYMWHTSGPNRGEPRGFAFVEFETREKAGKAQNALNGKVIAGRAMVVHFAEEKVHMQNSAPVEALMMGKLAATGMGSASGGGGFADAGKGQGKHECTLLRGRFITRVAQMSRLWWWTTLQLQEHDMLGSWARTRLICWHEFDLHCHF